MLLAKDKKITGREDLNVVLMTIDTLRADRVGYGGHAVETPHLDRLARGGARVMNAVCQVPLTLPSHASILTGTDPPFHRVKNNGTYSLREQDTTLAEILRKRGYQTAAFIGAFPLDSQFGLDQGFDLYDDQFKNPEPLAGYEPQRRAEQVAGAAAAWLERNGGKKELFVWVHYYDPHLPYSPPAPFDKAYASPYDGEVAYTDVYVGKLVELLRKKGLGDRTLIVVAGDHGEGLGEHGEDTHGIFLYDSTLKIPLIFSCPGIIPGGIEVKGQARTVDIVPTILELLRIPVPSDCQGASLIPDMEGGNSDRESYAETYLPLLACGWSEMKSIRTGQWKFILAPKPELYDLARDPLEKDNVIDREAETAGRMLRRLKELEKRFPRPGRGVQIRLTRETRRSCPRWAMSGWDRSRVSPGIPIQTPKDRIRVFEDMVKAEAALAGGAPEEAAEILRRVVAEDPGNPSLLHFLGRAYQKLGDLDASIEALSRAVRLNPDDVYSHYLLARSYFRKGMPGEAKSEALLVLSTFADHLGSLMLLAEIHADAGEFERAVSYLERAVRKEPDDPTARLLLAHVLTLAKHYERAFAEYELLRTRTPDDPSIRHNLGMLSVLTGRPEEGIRYFLEELALREEPETRFLLGMTYGKLGRLP